MRIGYARVSTEEQCLALQEDALTRAGCDLIFSDHGISGTNFCRPGLDRALQHLGRGDTLVVWRLDRLGRSLTKLVDMIDLLGQRDIHFESLTESINTQSPSGTLIFHIIAALAQFERALISERTRAGLAAAKNRGVRVGRPRSLTEYQASQAIRLLSEHSIAAVAKEFGVHPQTLRRLWAIHKRHTESAGEFNESSTSPCVKDE